MSLRNLVRVCVQEQNISPWGSLGLDSVDVQLGGNSEQFHVARGVFVCLLTFILS